MINPIIKCSTQQMAIFIIYARGGRLLTDCRFRHFTLNLLLWSYLRRVVDRTLQPH